jgi:integrase
MNQITTQKLKHIDQEAQKAIDSTLIMLRNDGLRENTVTQIRFKLQELAANTDVFDPEAVKHYIATAISERTKKQFSDETRNKFAYSADKFYEKQGIQWKKPFYKVEEKTPLIPSTENVTLIIANASKKYATIFTLLAEIGCDGIELSKVAHADIDRQQGIISISGCKGHSSGTYKLKSETAEMLRVYLYQHPEEHPFPKSAGKLDRFFGDDSWGIARFDRQQSAKIYMNKLRLTYERIKKKHLNSKHTQAYVNNIRL